MKNETLNGPKLMKMLTLLVAGCLVIHSKSLFAEESVDKLISKLGERNKDVNDEIVRRGEIAVQPLTIVLQDEKASDEARIDAARLLGRIGGKNVVDPLRLALTDKAPIVRHFAILAFREVGPAAKDAIPSLVALLRKQADKSDLTFGRRELIETLGKIGGNSREAVEVLALCMEKQRCHEAALALTNFGEPGADVLVTLAATYAKDNHSEDKRRYGEAYQVVAWGTPPLPKEMIPAFKRSFEKGDFLTRSVASRALAGVGPAAIPDLAKYLDDKNPDLRAEAAEALATMNWFAARAKERDKNVTIPVSSDEFFPKLEKLYTLPDGKIDERIIKAMIGIDHDRFMSDPVLFKVLQDEFNKNLTQHLEKRND